MLVPLYPPIPTLITLALQQGSGLAIQYVQSQTACSIWNVLNHRQSVFIIAICLGIVTPPADFSSCKSLLNIFMLWRLSLLSAYCFQDFFPRDKFSRLMSYQAISINLTSLHLQWCLLQFVYLPRWWKTYKIKRYFYFRAPCPKSWQNPNVGILYWK